MLWKRARRRGGWGAALFVGLGLRLGLLVIHARFQGDTLIYGDLAQNVLTHHVYGLTEDGHVRATLIRLPGYPLFLAVCFALFGMGRYLPVLWVQVFVDLLGCWLLGRTAERLFGPRVGLCCVWLASLCVFTANYAVAALTETLSIFCVVVAFWGLVGWCLSKRAGWAVAVGAALSGAVLLRPDGILLSGAVLPAMAWSAWQGDRIRRKSGGEKVGPKRGGLEHSGRGLASGGVVLAAGMVSLCLGLWTLRNWRVYHVLQPLAPKYANDPGEAAPTGFARWYRTWGTGLGDTARVYWEYDGSAMKVQDLPSWAMDGAVQRAETAAVYARYNEETSSTPEVEQAFAELARERERAHPVRTFVLMPLARLGDMWLRPRTELLPKMPVLWWQPKRRPRATLLACVLGMLNFLLLGAAVRGWQLWRRAGWCDDGVIAATMLGYVALRSTLLLTIDNSEPRYVLEGYPILLVMAAVAIAGRRRPVRHG